MLAHARTPRNPAAAHEVVLDAHGDLTTVRGLDAGGAESRSWEDLVALARRAGRLDGPHELSFYWRAGDRSLAFATIRSSGAGGRTSLTWLEDSAPPYGITQRELEVLTLLAGGLPNAEIGERLWTSVRTVTTHVERLLAKLEARRWWAGCCDPGRRPAPASPAGAARCAARSCSAAPSPSPGRSPRTARR